MTGTRRLAPSAEQPFSEPVPGAPEAPVWRPGPKDGVVPLESRRARHTGPHSAAGGAVSGLQPAPAAPVRDCGRDRRQIAPARPAAGHRLPNPTGPELMSAKERLAEVAALLARGFLRYWLRKAAGGRETCPPSVGRNGLAILRTSSHECPKPATGPAGEPESEGESL